MSHEIAIAAIVLVCFTGIMTVILTARITVRAQHLERMALLERHRRKWQAELDRARAANVPSAHGKADEQGAQ